MKYKQERFIRVLILWVALCCAVSAAQDITQAPSDDDQSSVVGCLRTIHTAEIAYAKTYKTGFSPTLKALAVPDEGAIYSASAAGLIDASLGSSKQNGYVFKYTPGMADAQGKVGTYTVSARPTKWQKRVRNLFADQTGVVRSTTENRAANAKDSILDK
jgi:hypothetical protein